jgi:hypothetical protein
MQCLINNNNNNNNNKIPMNFIKYLNRLLAKFILILIASVFYIVAIKLCVLYCNSHSRFIGADFFKGYSYSEFLFWSFPYLIVLKYSFSCAFYSNSSEKPFGVRKNNLDWETALICRCLSLIFVNASLGYYTAIALNFRHFFSHYDKFLYAFEPLPGYTTFWVFSFFSLLQVAIGIACTRLFKIGSNQMSKESTCAKRVSGTSSNPDMKNFK